MKLICLKTLLLFILILSGVKAIAQVSCSGSTVVCDNGGTLSCPSDYPFPSCRCGYPNCLSNSLINSGFTCSSLAPSPTCSVQSPQPSTPTTNPSTPSTPPPQPSTQPTIPTNPITPTCNASLLFIICMSTGSSPNFVTCTCNASSNPTTSTPTPTTSLVMCYANLTACPNDTTADFLCCQHGCCPSSPRQCKCSDSDQCDPNCTAPAPPLPQSTKSISLEEIFEGGNNVFKVLVTASNFDTTTKCKVTSSAKMPNLSNSFNLQVRPATFQLGTRNNRQLLDTRVGKILLNSLQNASGSIILIKVFCYNGVRGEIGLEP